MKKFVVYGNCQCEALARTLLENPEFSNKYKWNFIRQIQLLTKDSIDEVINKIQCADLFIFQPIRTTVNRPEELSSNYLLNKTKKSAICISFPSLYFDGYFPHLAPMNRMGNILAQAHDYIIAYCSSIGLNKYKIFELIDSDNLYPYDVSNLLVDKSINNLEDREFEDKIDLKISTFIRENYRKHKLFNQFRHPRRPILTYLANMIFNATNCSMFKFSNNIEYQDNISVPTYKSTYLNLSLNFDENFEHYNTISGNNVHRSIVVEQLMDFYGQTENSFLRNIIKNNKPFVPEIVEEWLMN